MNLNILLVDILKSDGILDTYRFIPINKWNRVVIDRLGDIHQDVKGNTDHDIGLNRVYNSDKCELIKTKCKIVDFIEENDCIKFSLEHMYVPIDHGGGSAGIYNFIVPLGYRLTEIFLIDPFDSRDVGLEEKKQFRYEVIWDKDHKMQVIEMELTSRRGSFSFKLFGKLNKHDVEDCDFVDSYEVNSRLSFEPYLNDYLFDQEIKKSFFENLKESLIFEPNFYGVGIDVRKLIKRK